MRPMIALVPLAMLTACVQDQPATQPDAGPDLRAMQESACTAAIAAHIRRPVADVRSTWASTQDGVAMIEARDGNRLHLCRVDAGGRVLGYIHPNMNPAG
ncbi:hypothetical protein [Paracoccus pacificus]|uniref:Peptidase inhibitor I78 family protein n=1 Tax=Paracoccus pacificus TaxID=1463598 RepID=A0ABW4R4H1_9RHOB